MPRVIRVPEPPRDAPPELRSWMQDVASALNALPAISMFSGHPNDSGVTADAGTLGFDVSSTATQRLWVNVSGTTSSWSFVSYA